MSNDYVKAAFPQDPNVLSIQESDKLWECRLECQLTDEDSSTGITGAHVLLNQGLANCPESIIGTDFSDKEGYVTIYGKFGVISIDHLMGPPPGNWKRVVSEYHPIVMCIHKNGEYNEIRIFDGVEANFEDRNIDLGKLKIKRSNSSANGN